MTGLHINFDKSTFTPIDIPTSRRGEPAGQHPLLPVATFPQTYLGLRLSIHKVRLTDLQLLTKSVSSYIPEWCGKLLASHPVVGHCSSTWSLEPGPSTPWFHPASPRFCSSDRRHPWGLPPELGTTSARWLGRSSA